MYKNQSPTNLTFNASLIMLNRTFVTREKINESILETDKEIEKMKAKLILKEDKLTGLKALTDEDLNEIIKEYDRQLDKILDILDKQNSEDASKNALVIRSLRADSELPKPS